MAKIEATARELRGQELFDAVMTVITEQPWHWRQDVYAERTDPDDSACGCVAALAVMLVHGEDALDWYADEDDDGEQYQGACSVTVEDGETEGVYFVARRLLQIGADDADRLFAGYNTVDEIRTAGEMAYRRTEPE